MLSNLLELGPGHSLALEVYGDVAATRGDQPVLVEEDKSSLAGKNPVSDRSPQFWKTLRNWLDMANQGALDPARTSLRIFVLQNYEPGKLITQLHEARNPEAARQALSAARQQLLAAPSPTAATPSLPEQLADHVQLVLSADDDAVIPLITNLELCFGEVSSIDDIRLQLKTSFVPTDLLDETLFYLLGWIKAATDAQIEQGKPACITFDELHREATTYLRKVDRRSVLASFAKAPPSQQVEQHLQARLYVRQLQIIEETDATQLQAVNDYLLATADRVIWAEKGHVHASSFDDLESVLERAWTNLKTRIDVQFPSTRDTERGRFLYADCSLHKATVEGVEPPAHFVIGSFHALADTLAVGWHPRYRELLSNNPRTNDGSAES